MSIVKTYVCFASYSRVYDNSTNLYKKICWHADARKNGRNFTDDIFNNIFLNYCFIHTMVLFLSKGQIDNNYVLIYLMAWRRTVGSPFCQSCMTSGDNIILIYLTPNFDSDKSVDFITREMCDLNFNALDVIFRLFKWTYRRKRIAMLIQIYWLYVIAQSKHYLDLHTAT